MQCLGVAFHRGSGLDESGTLWNRISILQVTVGQDHTKFVVPSLYFLEMKVAVRILVLSLILLMTPMFLLIRHFLDLVDQYSAFTYFQTSLIQFFFWSPPEPPHAIGVEADDKIIVMARTETEDTDWVARELPSSVLPFYEL